MNSVGWQRICPLWLPNHSATEPHSTLNQNQVDYYCSRLTTEWFSVYFWTQCSVHWCDTLQLIQHEMQYVFCVSVASGYICTGLFSVRWRLQHKVVSVKLITTYVCFCLSECQQLRISVSRNFRPVESSEVTVWYIATHSVFCVTVASGYICTGLFSVRWRLQHKVIKLVL